MKKRVLSWLLVLVLVLGILPGIALAADETPMGDEAAADVIYDELTGGNYSMTKTPLEFPYLYEGETYTNFISYLKAWALNTTGREIEITDYAFIAPSTKYPDWSSGAYQDYIPAAFQENGDLNQDYYKDNAPQAQGFSKLVFRVGEVSKEIGSYKLYGKAASLQRTPREIVDYVANNLPFARIQGKNESEDQITQGLGETSGNTTSLPTADKLYTKTSATIAWTLANTSGKSDALTLASNKITVLRPNVNEDDATFTLTATVISAADNSTTATRDYLLTVPAFEGVVVPIQVTEGATLSLTDGYYKNAPVDSSYIVKQDSAPEGYDLYYCTLHSNATGGNQSFKYTVSKDGYITKTDSFNVGATAPQDPMVIDLTASSEQDTKLETLEILAPTVEDFDFDPDVTEYSISVKGAQFIKLTGTAFVPETNVKITSYYSSLANANSGKLTTTGKVFTASGISCYLPDEANKTSDIVVTVTAPDSSTQAETTRTYTLHVTKTEANGPMTNLAVTAISSGNGIANKWEMEGVVQEETLSPSFVAGGREDVYYYTVNYFRDQVKVKPTAQGCTITVNGETVASGKDSAPIALNVGDNEIVVAVTKDDTATEYKLIVHRKAELRVTNVTLEEGALSTTLSADGSNWTGSCNFAYGADTIHVTYHTNVTDGVTIRVVVDGKTYEGVPGRPIEIPVGDRATIMPYTYLLRTVDGVSEGQRYVISFKRMAADSPSAVTSYLPAPGQFVNLDSYLNPDRTLTGNSESLITLGAFGGSVVYRYDEPILNDPANPYGIDFIVMGNCFTNADNSTSSGAAEPAAVMVSQDGVTWYELAGSEYYTATARHGLTLTYTNGDPAFTAAADTPWIDSDGGSGVMPKNAYHDQPYYPNPAIYSKFQNGVGKNDSYSDQTVSFTGTMINAGFYPFGYADSHTRVVAKGNQAENPYAANHAMYYNGDGFDLAWAVDAQGNPVELEEISYIKIYNPVLSYGGSTGEKSPEINAVLRAKPAAGAVGVSSGLSSLSVNGSPVELENGVFTYTVDGAGATSLRITPATVNPNANIYVSNQRVTSGQSSAGLAAVEKLRILVQEENKEPVIYILNFTNVATPSANADLSSLTLTPGDVVCEPDDGNTLHFEVDQAVTAVRLQPVAANGRAGLKLSGKTLTEAIDLTSGSTSEVVKLEIGKNVFTLTVTSVNGQVEKVYTVTVTRAQLDESADKIRVTFSLTGDGHHYDINTAKYTGPHTTPTWIAATTISVPKYSTVKYLTELMLNNAGLDFTSDGIYISELNGLCEFDNGPNSGWMYRQNGLIADEGYATRILDNGDKIQWFYTDDYTKEVDYEGGWDNVNSGSSDQKAAAAVEKLIKAIGTVTKDSGKQITAAREAYEALTETQKQLVSNYATLTAAEKAYAKLTGSLPFTDVEEHWALEAIAYSYTHDLMNGISADKFYPESSLNRAMLATILYRLAGEPDSKAENVYSDVADAAWYTEAVLWASEAGVVTGYGDGTFGPEDNITREQMAAMLYRYAAYQKYDVTAASGLQGFSDAGSISAWALEALEWAHAEQLINGRSTTTIVPGGSATRAEAATILMRFCEHVAE